MRRPSLLLAGGVLAGVLASTLGTASPAGAAVTRPGHCRTVRIPVTLPAPEPDPSPGQVVSALFCTPAAAAPGRPIDVTVPGATYTSMYWDWPQQPRLYNWTAKALAGGAATLDYDRLGTGASTSPPADNLTMTSDAAVLHQVIAWARQSAGYSTVNVVAHSMGSAVAAQDAGTWPADPTRLVLTGMLNLNSPAAETALASDVYPAADDPQFPGAGPGYLTTVPGVRGSLFYSPSANPAVISFDEAHKSVATGTEFATMSALFGAPAGSSITNQITAPVLMLAGQQDQLFCTAPEVSCATPGAAKAYELPYFTSSPSLTVRIIPGAGHDLALEPSSANLTFAMMAAWLAVVPANRG